MQINTYVFFGIKCNMTLQLHIITNELSQNQTAGYLDIRRQALRQSALGKVMFRKQWPWIIQTRETIATVEIALLVKGKQKQLRSWLL